MVLSCIPASVSILFVLTLATSGCPAVHSIFLLTFGVLLLKFVIPEGMDFIGPGGLPERHPFDDSLPFRLGDGEHPYYPGMRHTIVRFLEVDPRSSRFTTALSLIALSIISASKQSLAGLR